MRRTYKKITKEDLQFIVDNAKTMTNKEIAEKLGVGISVIVGHITALRKFGVDIPKKSFSSNRETIIQFANEWKSSHPKT